MPPGQDVIRLFLPLGCQTQLQPSATATCSNALPARAHCRPHSQGLDIYLHAELHHEPCNIPLHATEYAAQVVWSPAEGPGATAAAAGSAALSQPPRPPSTRRASETPPPPPSNPSSSCQIILFGVQRVRWAGRLTDVPATAAVDPAPPHGPRQQLQVFLYDQRAWRQVARTEAGPAAGWAAAPVPEPGAPSPDGADADPLPLRLALRPRGNPGLRQEADCRTAAPPAAAATVTAAATTSPVSTGVAVAAEAAGGGGGGSLPASPPPPALAAWALQRAAGCVVRHSATARHIQHMVACVGALHDLYGSTRRRPAAAAGPTGWTCLRLRLLGRQGAEDPAEAGPGLLPVPPPSGPRAAPSAASQPGRASTAVDAGIAAGRQGQRSGSGAASSGQRVHSCSSNSHSSIGPSVRADGRAGEVADGGGNSGGGGGAWCGSGPEAAAAPAAAPLRGLAAVAAACLVLSLVAQLVAGPPVAAAVWRRRATLMAAVEGAAAAAERLLREQYDWLMTATPAGVKLHGELCALMGTAAHGGLTAAAAARWGWRRCGGAAVGLLAAGFAVGGLGGGLSVAHDLLLAACVLPLGLQAALSGELLRRHLAWLGTAWQLMRGRQQRRGTRHRSHHRDQQRQPQGPEPLSSSLCEGPPVAGAAGAAGAAEVLPREPAAAAAGAAAGPAPTAAPGAQRRRRWRDRGSLSSLFHRGAAAAGARRQGQGGGEGGGPRPLLPISRLESLLGLAPDPGSGDEVVIEQLIVGVLLGVPLLALLPTAAAWRALAVAAWGLPAAVRAGLAAAAGALRDNPVITLTWRALRPLDFADRQDVVSLPEGRGLSHGSGGEPGPSASGPNEAAAPDTSPARTPLAVAVAADAGPDIMVHCIPTGAAPAGGTPAAAGGPEGQGAAARDGGAAGCSSRGARAAGGGGGGGGVVFGVEPVPLPWGAVVGTWVARGLRGGWGDLPGAGAGAVEGEEQRRERRKAAGGVAARLRWLWGGR